MLKQAFPSHSCYACQNAVILFGCVLANSNTALSYSLFRYLFSYYACQKCNVLCASSILCNEVTVPTEQIFDFAFLRQYSLLLNGDCEAILYVMMTSLDVIELASGSCSRFPSWASFRRHDIWIAVLAGTAC